MKPQPFTIPWQGPNGEVDDAVFWRFGEKREDWPSEQKSPYGRPGDRLWVRETFQLHTVGTGEIRVTYREGNEDRFVDPEEFGGIPDDNGWRPSIFMPRWASRITLEIEAVRVERLQDISEEDAQLEGIETVHCENFGAWRNYAFKTSHTRAGVAVNDEHHRIVGYKSAVRSFRSLWDSINDNSGFGWDTNPWVWVIQFKRVDGVASAEGGTR